MKRSRRTGLLALSAASVLALSGCYEEDSAAKVSLEQHNQAVYSNLEACLEDAAKTGVSAEVAVGEKISPLQKLRLDCMNDWEAAKAEHVKNAPRFASLAQCEAEFGTGNCAAPASPGSAAGQVVASGNSGESSFMPMMMGYMLGSMMSGSRHSAYPAYSSASGSWRSTVPSATSRLKSTASTSAYVGSSGSRSSLSASKFSGGKVVTPMAPKVTGATSARTSSGGFGASRSFSGSARSSFGG
ncbi:DUF1190 domain-containing protein [Paracoccus litorisediminis]|uniref:DUF1190 domain-containing protein n=1 Tax=Paracoccus litorisediminis TaxID=2006130 RepID=UPI0037318F79